MINVYAITTALKTVVSNVAGVGGVRIGSGDLTKLDTVAVEIVPINTVFETQTAGKGFTSDITNIDVYLACRANEQDPQDHEQRLHTVVKALVDTITERSFDKTFSGACEFFMPVEVAYDYIRDTNKLYFAAVLRLEFYDERT
jgi:hypothetical protein